MLLARSWDVPGLLSRIKRVSQQQVQVVKSQRELPVGVGGFRVRFRCLEPLPGFPEADAQRRRFMLVAQGAEQVSDLVARRLAERMMRNACVGEFRPAMTPLSRAHSNWRQYCGRSA